MMNLSANAMSAIVKGCEMMGWDFYTSNDMERICAGLYWINEYIENIKNYTNTRKAWEKVERELEKAYSFYSL